MFQKRAYFLFQNIALLFAIMIVALLSSDLKELLIEQTLSLKLLVLIAAKILMILLFLSVKAGVFDSQIAKIIRDDSKVLVPISSILTTQKETLYKVFIHWGGIFLILGMFSFNWISYDMHLIFTQIIGITDLHIFLLFLFLIIFQKEILRLEILIFVLMFGFYLIYAQQQGHGLTSSLLGFKDYFTVIMLFLFFKYFRFKNETISHYIKIFKIIILAQLPVQLFQFLILRDPEFCSGTFGYHQTGVMGIFMAGIVLYLISIKKINGWIILLILYLSFSLLIGSSLFFFIINIFLIPIVLLKKYRVSLTTKVVFVVILCLIFLGFLRFSKVIKEEAEAKVFNPFYYVSNEYLRDFFAINKVASLHRGGAIIWAYKTLQNEYKLFAGRGLGWLRSLSDKQRVKFSILTISYDFPMILLICGILGLFIFLYLAFKLFMVRIRMSTASPELKFFILCLTVLYIIGGIYSNGWISKTVGYSFAMLIGLLSNINNRKFFIEKYFVDKIK